MGRYVTISVPIFVLYYYNQMRTLTTTEYQALQQEVVNNPYENDSVDVWYSPEYYTYYETFSNGQIWY